MAQGSGANGINDATTLIISYFEPLTRLIFGVAAIVGLIGAIRVYSKFSSGDPNVTQSLAAWFGACIFLVIVGVVLQSFFL